MVISFCKGKTTFIVKLYCKTVSIMLLKQIVIMLAVFSLIPVAFAQEYPDLGVNVETVADKLTIPWSIDWLPDGSIIFTERNGNLRIIQDSILQEPLLSLGVGGVEGGLLGVAVDPNFESNEYIYLYYTYNEFLSTINKVVRYQLNDGEITEDKVLIDEIPGGPFHDGGRIQFGPDGKLYITTGEAGNPDLSQDMNSLGGKILRINSDGTIPEDNPWEESPIYSIGHRNPQGIDWDEYGNLVATEHGPSGWRGSAHDEINLIIAGKNYGWPDIIGNETKEGLEIPILHTGDDTWAPSGSEFYDGDKIPEWNGKYFVATLRGSHLHMIEFENNEVVSHEKLFQDDFGRLRDVATGPDGFLYLLTSNQDGRGNPNPNDDKILKIMPINTINNFEECVAAGNPVMESHPRQCSTKDGQHFVEDISTPEWITAPSGTVNEIPEELFEKGIRALIREGILSSPQTNYDLSSKLEYPLWIQKNAKWWNEGLITDKEFVDGIQWMLNQSFIK